MTTTDKVWGDYPVYYKQPYRWFKYHAHTKPHFVWAVGLGLSAPLLLAISPIRRKYLYSDHEPIPKVYPLPTRARDTNLAGFDDE